MTAPPLDPESRTEAADAHYQPIGCPPSLPCGCPLDGQCDGYHSIVDAWSDRP